MCPLPIEYFLVRQFAEQFVAVVPLYLLVPASREMISINTLQQCSGLSVLVIPRRREQITRHEMRTRENLRAGPMNHCCYDSRTFSLDPADETSARSVSRLTLDT